MFDILFFLPFQNSRFILFTKYFFLYNFYKVTKIYIYEESMDVQLQELIDKIKKDGVASAENASAAIIAEAEKAGVQDLSCVKQQRKPC